MKNFRCFLLVIAFLLAQVGITLAAWPVILVGDITPGSVVHATATAAGSNIQFTLYAPPTYDPNGSKRWPLIILFPPAGATSKPNEFDILGACAVNKLLMQNPSTCKYVSDRFVVVSPMLPSSGYPAYFVSVHNWIKYLYKTYKIDSTCVSFYGTCWGGNAAYSYITLHPEVPSAAYLFAINDGWSWQGGGLDLTKACQLKNISLRIVNASGDPYTKWQNCKATADAIHACGGGKDTFMLINYPLHEVYNWMDTIKGMYDWFLLQKNTGATTAAANPPEHPYGESFKNILPDQLLIVRLSASDQMEVLDVNGQQIYKCNGNGSPVKQLLPRMGRGLYLIRIRGSQSIARMLLIK